MKLLLSAWLLQLHCLGEPSQKTYHLKTTTVSSLSGNVIVANSDYSLSHNKTALNTFIHVAGKPHDCAVKPRPAPHALPWLAAAREFPSTPPPFYIVPDKYLVGSCASCCWNVAAVTVTPQTKEKVKHFFPQKQNKNKFMFYKQLDMTRNHLLVFCWRGETR